MLLLTPFLGKLGSILFTLGLKWETVSPIMKTFLSNCRLLLSTAAILLTIGTPKAQNSSCDEGVIRLPDRSGTIQICSTLASKVPQLSRQISDLGKAYGDQKQQIAELTRLVRGLNNVGRGLDVEKQARMLESLSTALLKAQSVDPQTSIAALNALTSRIDELQSRIFSAMNSPAGSAVLNDALKGALGEAISKLDLVQANDHLAGIVEQLKAVQTDIVDIKSNTSAIRQQIAQLDQRQREADSAREKREQASMDVLRRMADEVREFNQRGGLINNPTGYSAHYHNARVLTQRGEIDLAFGSYRQVFRSGVQMADPVVDLTTLLMRKYGRQAALRTLAQDFRKELPEQSYLYALQLLSDKELDEVEKVLFAKPKLAEEFPPLAAIYLQRLQERLTRNRSGDAVSVFTFAWVDLAAIAKVVEALEREIESGNFLAFYIDQIRGGRDLDEFRKVSEALRGRKVLQVRVPRLASLEELNTQSINLARSPVALDYTYFFDPPSSRTLSNLASQSSLYPKYRNGSVFLYIWDASIDPSKPILICSSKGSSYLCRDINAEKSRCSERTGDRAINCLLTREASNRTSLPNVEAHFVSQDLIGAQCISRVTYTSTQGREIAVDRDQLIGAFRRKSDLDIENLFENCGYDTQSNKPVNSKQETNEKPPTPSVSFAAFEQPEREMPYNRDTCEALESYSVMGSRTFASHMLDDFLIKLSHVTKSFPLLPSILRTRDGDIGRFDDSDGKCKIMVVVNSKMYTCAVEKLVKSRWLPANLSQMKGTVPAHSIKWNGGIFPDVGSNTQCTAGDDVPNDASSSRLRSSTKSQTVDQIKRFDSHILHGLAALGAGHSARCDTLGYTSITFRLRRELGLRAIERNICGLRSTVRKTVLLQGQQITAEKIIGCFTKKNYEIYVRRANDWLDSSQADCEGAVGREIQEFAQDAVEWVIEQAVSSSVKNPL